MKKVLLIAVGLVLGAGAFAQEGESAGNKMWIGGTVGFGSSNNADGNDNTNDVKTSGWEFGPTFGFMLNDKMAVGINLMVDGKTTTKNNKDADETKVSGYNFEPFFRYYFAGTGNFKFYGDATVNFGGGKTTWSDNTGSDPVDSKYSKFGVGLHPGVQYWFTDDWSMASTIGLVGFSQMSTKRNVINDKGNKVEVTDKVSDFGLIGDFSSLKFSFFYHF